ncbi:uncharacterized protein LOC123894582 [Trifolium pratense]|uniref:uncharacterized protein LOC123894582 n=1 Tax=Trifolium pratense TaxID=57577 RepID=UPI001E694E64|nr:uncharacterized protein LOC123894582 [Trifolium pratense]
MIHALKLEEAALEATDAGVDENLSVDAGGDNEEEDSEVEDEGNDSPRQCLCELCLRSEEVCRISEKQKETISKLQTERIVNLTKISEIGVKCEEGLKTIEEQKAIIANLETDKLEQLAEISKLNEEGHIRPYCYKLYGYPNETIQEKLDPSITNAKKEWKQKVDVTNTKGCAAESCEKSLIAHTSLRASSKEDWYFDSGCSKHMTGVEKYLMDIKSYATSFVTFGDGAKGEIKGTATTLCELWKNRKPTVKYFNVFRSKWYILADREPRRKFDPKSDEGIFLGYSTNNRAYRVFNSRTKTMMESINVVIDDTDLTSIDSAEETDVVTPVPTPDDDQAEYDSIQDFEPNTENLRPNKGPSIRVQKNHSKEISIRNPDQGVTIRISTYVILKNLKEEAQSGKLRGKLSICLFKEL